MDRYVESKNRIMECHTRVKALELAYIQNVYDKKFDLTSRDYLQEFHRLNREWEKEELDLPNNIEEGHLFPLEKLILMGMYAEDLMVSINYLLVHMDLKGYIFHPDNSFLEGGRDYGEDWLEEMEEWYDIFFKGDWDTQDEIYLIKDVEEDYLFPSEHEKETVAPFYYDLNRIEDLRKQIEEEYTPDKIISPHLKGLIFPQTLFKKRKSFRTVLFH